MRERFWLIVTTVEWDIRPPTGTLKRPDEKIVKHIKCATRKHSSSEEQIRIVLNGLFGEDSIAELFRPLPGRVVHGIIPRGVKAFPKASYHVMRAHDLITRPAIINQLWKTDFTYL